MERKTLKRVVIISLILITVIAATSIFTQPNTESNDRNIKVESNNTPDIPAPEPKEKEQNYTNPEHGRKQNLISPEQAIKIVKNTVPGYGKLHYSATLTTCRGKPAYLVTVYDKDPDSETYGQAIGGAYVDATTGKLLYGHG